MKTSTFLIVLGLFFLTACSTNEESAKVLLTFQGVNENYKPLMKSAADGVIITDFKISIRDIDFKDNISSSVDSTSIKFKGPYDIDLMSETGAISQTLGDAVIPDGNYKWIRFKMHKSRNRATTDDLYDRSFFMKGTISGTPFEFWHDASENLDIESVNPISVADNQVEITIRFDIDQFMNSLHTIDLNTATDEDANGLIQINPDNDDGNKDLANQLKDNIKKAADMIKKN